MVRINKKHLNTLILQCVFYYSAFAQGKSGIENYNLLSQGKQYIWMPVVHYQTAKGVYAELRYNYEEVQTLSFYAGKTFAGGNSLKYIIIPMAGISTGKFTGISLAANGDVEWKFFYISSQTQYSKSTQKGSADFIYSWSEFGFNISDKYFGGLAIQYTWQQDINDVEPGFVTGLNLKNISIPIYVFSPFKAGRNFIIGFNYEFNFKKK